MLRGSPSSGHKINYSRGDFCVSGEMLEGKWLKVGGGQLTCHVLMHYKENIFMCCSCNLWSILKHSICLV